MGITNSAPTQPATTPEYGSLEQISNRKDALRSDIRRNEDQIRQLWRRLFTKPQPFSALTPSKRISAVMSTGTGVLDGIILGWKLYRKFKRKK